MSRRPIPEWPRAPELAGKDKGHVGIKPPNMPWPIYLACYDGERVDTQLYARFNRDMSIDELYDILEMQETANSWKHAYHLNNPKDDE